MLGVCSFPEKQLEMLLCGQTNLTCGLEGSDGLLGSPQVDQLRRLGWHERHSHPSAARDSNLIYGDSRLEYEICRVFLFVFRGSMERAPVSKQKSWFCWIIFEVVRLFFSFSVYLRSEKCLALNLRLALRTISDGEMSGDPFWMHCAKGQCKVSHTRTWFN